MSHVDIQELFQACEKELIQARDMMQAQQAPDMANFQTIISDLCHHIANLPRDEAEAYQEHLAALSEALTAIESMMQAQKQLATAQLKELNGRQDAHSAYKNQPSEG